MLFAFWMEALSCRRLVLRFLVFLRCQPLLAIVAMVEVPVLRLVRLRCLVYRRRRFRRHFLITAFASASEIGCVRSRFRLNCSSCLCQIAMFG